MIFIVVLLEHNGYSALLKNDEASGIIGVRDNRKSLSTSTEIEEGGASFPPAEKTE